MPLILFNKPFQVLCQFSGGGKRPTLADFIPLTGIYPAGRLDADSEGLMLLTEDGALQHRISHPNSKQAKTYLVQVEGKVDETALMRLSAPLQLEDFTTQASIARHVAAPGWLWPRKPPIRERRQLSTDWLSITITEGKNRQVRRMSAAVGLPTLRLVRIAIGGIALHSHPLMPGEYCEVDPADLEIKDTVVLSKHGNRT